MYFFVLKDQPFLYNFQDSILEMPVSSCFLGNDTFHFEEVEQGLEASHNLGVRMNMCHEHWSPLKQKT
jgi:hypothetical protein